jgi:uncharacterized protein
MAIDLCRPKGRLTVELAGGEPLTAFDLVKEIVGRAGRRKPPPRLALQTNGLLLDKAKLGFLRDNGVGLGLSLDGPPKVHDLLRGRGEETIRALNLLDQADLGVNITTVVTSQNVDSLPEFLLFCAGHRSVRTINLDLVRDIGRARGRARGRVGGKAGGGAGDRDGGGDLSPRPEQIQEMAPRLVKTLAFIQARRFPPLKVREVDQVRRRRGLAEVRPYCLAAAGATAAVDPAGRLWPCASLTDWPELAAGTVWEPEPDKLAAVHSLWRLPPGCAGCPVRVICRGGCPARRLAETGRADGRSRTECLFRRELYQALT